MMNNIGDARRAYAETVDGFTQKDAAEYFGVSLSTYKKWEQGQGKLNGGILLKIADKYGVTVDFLLDVNRRVVAKPQSPALTSDEQHLISLYRNMDREHREVLLQTARAFSALTEKDGTPKCGIVRTGAVDVVKA